MTQPLRHYIDAQPYPRTKNACAALGVNRTQLHRWLKAGAYIIDGTVYVPATKQRKET